MMNTLGVMSKWTRDFCVKGGQIIRREATDIHTRGM